MKKILVFINLFFVLFIIFAPFCYADNNLDVQNNDLKQKIEQLNKERTELSDKLAVQTDINKLLIEKENNILSSTDNTINRINSMLTLLSVIVGIIVTVATVGTFWLQSYRFNLLEKEIEKSKEEYNKSRIEFNDSKTEYDKSKAEFETVKTEARTATECAATTQDSYEEIQIGYAAIKNDLEGIKSSFKSLADDRINELEKNSNKTKNELLDNYNKTKKDLDNIMLQVNELVDKAKQSENEAKKSETKSKASEYFNKALNSINEDEKMALYTKAIEYDNNHDASYNNRGNVNFIKKEYLKAIDDYNNAIKIAPNSVLYLKNRAKTYLALAKEYTNSSIPKKSIDYYNNALKDFQSALDLVPQNNVELSEVYNSRADSYRIFGNIELALNDVNKAIEINNGNGYAYATLAEICATQNDDVGFYKNAEQALLYNCPIWESVEVDPIYNKYKNTPEFLKLINKYRGSIK